MKKLLTLVSLICFFAGTPTFASHIIGGVVNYQYLGNDQYTVTVIVYRDCNSATQFQNPITLNAFTADGNLFDNFPISNPVITTVDPPTLPPCVTVPSNVCVQQAVFTTTITLPPSVGGYNLMYTICCRNGNIINIDTPTSTSSSFVGTIPADTAMHNSNAVFNEFPPTFICLNTPLTFDHSATDADGDSLVYSFCAPSDGAALGSTPTAPPYPDVAWSGTYSATNPISASVPFAIDPSTGLLTGTPDAPGRYVVGICVTEYRNGVFVTTTKRDFQFNVIACENAIASIPQLVDSCSGPTITFVNNSSNATSYFWDFGVTGVTTDTSSLTTPTFTYPDTGTYTITLIAYNTTGSGSCTDTITGIYIVRPLLDATLPNTASQCIRGNVFDFTAGGTYVPSANIQWLLPGASGAQTASGTAVNNVTYPNAGQHTVSVIISQYNCIDTATTTFNTYPQPQVTGSVQIPYCNSSTVQFNSASTPGGTLLWNFGTGNTGDTSVVASPGFTYQNSGNYVASVTVTDTATQCFTTDTVGLYVPADPPLVLGAMRNRSVLCKGDTLQFSANFTGGKPGYGIAWNNATFGNQLTYVLTTTQPQLFQVVVRDSCGKRDTANFQVGVPSYSPVTLSLKDDTTICSYENYQLAVTAAGGTNSYNYTWTSNNLAANILNPGYDTSTVIFNANTRFFVLVSDACKSTARDSIEIGKKPCDINPPNVFTPNGDNSNNKFVVSNLDYYPNTRLTIFNRWGNMVYQTANYSIDNTWDGNNADAGVYYYIIDVPLAPPQTLTGFVQLLR